GLDEVPVIVVDHLSDAQRRALVIADNRIAENAGWDETMLRAELAALRDDDFDLDLIGFDEGELDRLLNGAGLEDGVAVPSEGAGDAESPPGIAGASKLAERFGVPPFTVLDARKGWWQDRKRAWLDLGIRSELGRGAAPGGAPRPLDRGWSGEKSFPAVPGMGTADPAPIHKDIDHYRHKEGKRTPKEAAHG